MRSDSARKSTPGTRWTYVLASVVLNYNSDISQFWEWSGRGLRPIDDTNEAYKLGVNYLLYGLTH
jgi:hypothetical protein